jgi:hypothetical protein
MCGQLFLSAQPQSQIGYWGQSVTLSVGATTIAPPLAYQWFKTSSLIAGATNQTLVLTNLQGSDPNGT